MGFHNYEPFLSSSITLILEEQNPFEVRMLLALPLLIKGPH